MLEWLRLYTLGSRGLQELKTFLKICLISSRIVQKLKNKKGEYIAFKGDFGPKICAVWCDHGSDFPCRHRGSQIGTKWATIAQRSRHNHALIVVLWEKMPAVRSASSWADDRDCLIKLSHSCDYRFSLIDLW